MESSFAGAPPAVAEEPITQPSAPEVQPEPAQPAPAEPTQEAPSEDNEVLSAIQDLRSRVDALGKPAEEPETATSLLEALQAEPEEPEGYAPERAPEQQYEDPAAQQQLEELEQFIDARTQSALAPLQQERDEERIAALQDKFPDITSKPVLEKLEPLVTRLAERSGNENLIFDPQFVEMAYKAVKAELADAGAVPAEQVATQGASLETGAGGQAQAGGSGEDEIDQFYKQNVFGMARKSEL